MPFPDHEMIDDEMSLCLELHFKSGGNGLPGFLLGWCKPESAYTWTQGHLSELAFVRPEPGYYLLSLDGITLGLQRLILSVQGARGCAREEYRLNGPCSVTVPFEVSDDDPQTTITVRLQLPDANSPAAMYGEKDARILGFALTRLRVLRRTHAGRVLPPVQDRDIENAVGLDRSALVATFESLGHNCEFGMVQRHCDAEPLGLLRFSGITLANLLRGLTTDFAGLGAKNSIEHTFWQQDSNPEYIVVENVFNLQYHSGFQKNDFGAEELYRRESLRLQFYKRKILEDFASAEKIFVFHWHGSLMTREIMPLFAALREKGRNTLLWVVASSEHAPGTVEILGEGLLRGYIRHFAPSGAVDREVDLAPWLSVCANAYMFCNGHEKGDADPERVHQVSS